MTNLSQDNQALKGQGKALEMAGLIPFLKFRFHWQNTVKIERTNNLFIKNKKILNIINGFSDNKYMTIITFDSKSSMKKWEAVQSALTVFNVEKLKSLGVKFKKLVCSSNQKVNISSVSFTVTPPSTVHSPS